MKRLAPALPMRMIGLVTFSALCFAASLLATPDFQPVFKPSLDIGPAAGAIKIDGRLDEDAWKSASHVTNFVERQPGDNTQPPVRTDVFITYDGDRLYVAFVCHDDPAGIRASMSQRDQWSGDDFVGLLLDTYGEAAWAYEFFANPYGVQMDQLWTATMGTEDIGFDVIWESAGQITDSGYTVEMAIPFSSLRFPNQDSQTWRVEFWRSRPRETSASYTWSANNRAEQCWPCQWGTVTGIKNVHPGKGLEILPSIVAHQSSDLADYSSANAPFVHHDARGEVSLGTKYAITSDITAEATYNPDFSQIEADAAQIDVNTPTALFYPERRPFFQEGSDIFATLFNSFYTRTINAPKFAAKMTDRHGGTRIGAVFGYDENSTYLIPLDARSFVFPVGNSTAAVLRAARQFGNNSMIGGIITDRRYEHSGSGTVASVDGDLRLSQAFRLRGQYIVTHTAEPTVGPTFAGKTFDQGKHTLAFDGESYYGDALIFRLDQRTRYWIWFLGYNQIAPTYRTETGFDPVANHRTAEIYNAFVIRPAKGLITRISPETYFSRRWDFLTGAHRYDYFSSDVMVQTRFAQSQFQIGYGRNYELWEDESLSSTPLPSQGFDNLWQIFSSWNFQFNQYLGGHIQGTYGRGLVRNAPPARGRETDYSFGLSIKPIDRLTIEPELNYARITNLQDGSRYFNGYITRTRTQFQATKELSLRLIVQYDDFYKSWDLDPLVTYRLSPFSVLYLGSAVNYSQLWYARDSTDPLYPNPFSRWRTTSRQFFMKLQYLFQT